MGRNKNSWFALSLLSRAFSLSVLISVCVYLSRYLEILLLGEDNTNATEKQRR